MKKYFTKESLLKIFYSFIWVSVLVFTVDIITKWVIQNNLKFDGDSITLIPNFLFIKLSHNLGASFGMGSSGEIGWRIFWVVISIVLSGVLIYVFAKYFSKFNKTQKIALALMIGGAIGNMVDRLFYWKALVGFDGVIDWIDFQFGTWHFATFNIADSCLVIGVIILILIEIINLVKEVREKEKRGDYDLPPMELEQKQKEEHEDVQNRGK